MADTAINDDEIEEFFDNPVELDKKVTALAEAIMKSNHFVVYTGAGISTSAGISDFRGPDGVWTRKAKGLGHKAGNWAEAQPTFCHMSLVQLEKIGKLKFLISQNCDGLHIKSGIPPNKICELHGNTNVEACSKCGAIYYREFRVRSESSKTRLTGRTCDHCSTPLRYTTVAFSQSMPDVCIAKAEAESKLSDLSLCMGTSMRVTPACVLPRLGKRNPDFKLVIVNLQKTPYDHKCAIRIFARVDDVMESLSKKLQFTVPTWTNLNLHENTEWMTLFKETYTFRSAGVKDWFEGAHDGVDLKIPCTGCKAVLRYPEGVKTIKCPKCSTTLQVGA